MMKKIITFLGVIITLNTVAQCVSTTTINILTSYPAAPVICAGDSISWTAVGAVSYHWWTNSSSLTSSTQHMADAPTQSGTYYVQYTDSIGCVGIDSINVITSPIPTVSFSLVPDSIPHVWDVIPNVAGSGIQEYYWVWGDGTATDGATLYTTHTYSAAAIYDVCLYVYNFGCGTSYCVNDSLYRTSADNTIVQINVINNTSGINELSFQSLNLKIYPNPANSIINISSNEQNIQIKLVDVIGNQVLTTNQKEIDVSSLANGVYFLQAGNNTQKFIVQH